MTEPAKPYSKATQLGSQRKRYRRKVASRKQWERIVAEKAGPCRVCCDVLGNGHDLGRITFHHIVSRQDGGDDVPDNICPVHADCHDRLTQRRHSAAKILLVGLTDAEYAYMIERGGEDYPERAYGIRYER